MIVVSDTSPLNFLVQIDAIDLLESLFGSIVVPPAVLAELSHPHTPPNVVLWLESRPRWLIVQRPTNVLTANLPDGLGEREAISLALETGAGLLLADDRRARQSAELLGLQVIGTLGVLEQSAKLGILDLSSAVLRLQRTNFRVSDEVLAELLKRAGND